MIHTLKVKSKISILVNIYIDILVKNGMLPLAYKLRDWFRSADSTISLLFDSFEFSTLAQT